MISEKPFEHYSLITRTLFKLMHPFMSFLMDSSLRRKFNDPAITLKGARIQPGQKVLEVGCGDGERVKALREQGIDAYGIDINPAQVGEFAQMGDAENLLYPGNHFDVVYSVDVLEHLSKPDCAVEEIARVSKNGSLVAISLPLENSVQKFSRIGFKFTTPKPFSNNSQDTFEIPIAKTPDYHYFGTVSSYASMYAILKNSFSLLHTRYTPLGIHKSININAVHIFKK